MTSYKKKASFIIPHKGRQEFLYQTLRSIFALDFPKNEIEVLIMSQNDEPYDLSEFENNELNLSIHYLPKQQLTISALRNKGAEQAEGEYFAFLDADVALSANWLTTMLTLIEEKESRKLVSAMQINGENPPPLEQIRTVLSNAELDCNVNFLPGRNLFLHRETFNAVGGFPEHLITCEDYYFTDKVNELGDLFYSSAATYVHIGEDKDYLQMYKKEIWRGQSNLQSIKGRKIPLREWPSIVLPLGLASLALFTLIFVLLGTYSLAILSITCFILPIAAYSLRLSKLAKKTIAFRHVLKFYAYYFPARAIGTLLGIFKSISVKEN